jgi:hypothetical protein
MHLMATQMDSQKRKRADSTLDCITVLTAADIAANRANPPSDDETDDERFGLPCNNELDSDDSDVDQGDEEELEESTLFWVQRKLVVGKQETIRLEMPTLQEREARIATLTGKISLIIININIM